MNLEDVLLRGTRASQPLATAVATGTLYFVTDESLTEQSNGAAWVSFSGTSGGASTTPQYILGTTFATLPNSRVLSAGAGIAITLAAGFATLSNTVTTAPVVVTTTFSTLPNAVVSSAGAGISITNAGGFSTITNTVTNAEYIVATTYSTLPNSRVLTAGSNITITQTTGQTVIAASGGGGWTFITSKAASGTIVDFTNLTTYNEILCVMMGVGATGSCIRSWRMSTNNGSTFLSATTDYFLIDGSGGSTAQANLTFTNGNNATAQYGWVLVSLMQKTDSAKVAAAGFPTTNLVGFINTTLTLNAFRAFPSSNSFNTGTLFLYGKQ